VQELAYVKEESKSSVLDSWLPPSTSTQTVGQELNGLGQVLSRWSKKRNVEDLKLVWHVPPAKKR